MEQPCNGVGTTNAANGDEENGLAQGGYFRIKPLNGKLTLNLRGNFDSHNTKAVSKLMQEIHFFKKRDIELDMNEVETINMQAMALLIITLKKLKENGIDATVRGLDEEKRKLAYQLGMHYISKII